MPLSLEFLHRLYTWLKRQPKTFTLTASVLLLGLTALVDSRTNPYLSITAPYMASVLLAAVIVGPRWALLFAIAASISQNWLFASPQTPVGILAINTVSRFLGYAVVIWLSMALLYTIVSSREAARHDFLTLLLNRRAFEEMAAHELQRARRNGKPISVIYLDCDNFKEVNDQHGHATGDKVLIVIAETMRATLRSTDIIARLGGDEFAAILPETGEGSARTAATNLHEAVARRLASMNLRCTCSLGVAVFAAPPDKVEYLIRRADELMYRVKSGGKGTAQVDVFFGH